MRRRQSLRQLGACLALAGSAAADGALAEDAPVPLAVSDRTNKAFVQPLLDLLAQGAGLRWAIEWLPSSRLQARVERAEALGFGLSHSPARDLAFDFSDALFSNHLWALTRRTDALRIVSLQDLDGHTVCMTRGVSYGAAFDAARERRFRVEYADGEPQARLRMLQAQRCDVALVSHRSGNPEGPRRLLLRDPALQQALQVQPQPLLSETIHLVAARGSALSRWLPRVNTALRERQAAVQALIDSEL